MTIGEMARRAEVNVETVRYYQRIGLIPVPEKPRTGYRRYEDEDLSRLIAIKQAKKLGFSLDEVRKIQELRNSSDPCGAACGLARRTLHRVKDNIAELQALQASLEELLARQSRSDGCTVLEALDPVSGP